jgi:hypothetical protein
VELAEEVALLRSGALSFEHRLVTSDCTRSLLLYVYAMHKNVGELLML